MLCNTKSKFTDTEEDAVTIKSKGRKSSLRCLVCRGKMSFFGRASKRAPHGKIQYCSRCKVYFRITKDGQLIKMPNTQCVALPKATPCRKVIFLRRSHLVLITRRNKGKVCATSCKLCTFCCFEVSGVVPSYQFYTTPYFQVFFVLK